VTEPDCPYPGLRPFRQSEAKFFCGRSQHRIELLTKLEQSRFVAVVGASGSGKSSLVMAGLLCDIADGMLLEVPSGKSRVVYFKPGLNPFASLASSLSEKLDAEVREVERVLRRSAFGLGNVLDLFDPKGTDAYVVVADQFEELFRFATLSKKETEAPDFQQDRKDAPLLDGVHNEAQAFVDLLLEATRNERRQVFVVLTMRSDFLHRCEAFDRLPGMISAHQYLTPRLQRDQQADAVAVPLKHFQATIKPALVNLILNDLSPEQDQLPILQHALARIWLAAQVRKSNELAIADYNTVGGIANALNEHGEDILEDVFGRSGRRLGQSGVGSFFRCLAEFDPTGTLVRRPRTVAQVADESGLSTDDVRLIANCFRANFTHWLMPMIEHKAELKDNDVLDLTHESLVRKWKRLGAKPLEILPNESKSMEFRRAFAQDLGWMGIEQDRRDSLLRIKERMMDAGWKSDGTSPGAFALLMRVIAPFSSLPLTRIQFSRHAKALRSPTPTPAWGRRYGGAIRATRLFLRLVLFRLVLFWAGLAVIGGTIFYLYVGKRQQAQQLKFSELQLELANLVSKGEADSLAARIAASQKQNESLVAELTDAKQTIEQVQDRLSKQERVLEAANALVSGAPNLIFNKLRDLLQVQGYRPEVVTTAPVEAENILSRAVAIPAHDKAVEAVAFLEIDGAPMIASGALDHRTKLWKLDGSFADVIFEHDATSLTTVDGSQLVTASADAFCRVWTRPNLRAEFRLAPAAPGEGVVSGQVVSGGRVLMGTTRGRIALWAPGAGPPSFFPTQDTSVVNSINYLASRQWVLSSHDSGLVQLWSIKANPPRLLQSRKYGSPVSAASIDPTGKWALIPTGTKDVDLIRIEVPDEKGGGPSEKTYSLPHQALVVMGRFSAIGGLLATADNRGRIYLWSLASFGTPSEKKPPEALILSGHSKRVTALRWDPNGRCLASADESGTILLWQDPVKRVATRNARLPFVLPGHEAAVKGLAISRKGLFIATAGADKIVRIAPFYPTFAGKCQLGFGGLSDAGVAPGEGLALFDQNQVAARPDLFFSDQELADKGLSDAEIAKLGPARRLKADQLYVAARWDYSLTSRAFLRGTRVKVRNSKTGKEVFAQPVDWGPNASTGAVADLSPGLEKALGVMIGDKVEIGIDLLTLPEASAPASAE